MSSHMRYDPVHDMDNAAPSTATTAAPQAPQPQGTAIPASLSEQQTTPADHKVAISSLLSSSVDQEPANTSQEEIVTVKEESGAQAQQTPSKRVLLANKRKNKDQEPKEPNKKAKKAALPPYASQQQQVKIVRDMSSSTSSSSVSASRSRHLKKPDSEPLWRSDIQHDFLQALLLNNLKFLSNPYDKIDEDIKYWSLLNGNDGSSSLGYTDKLTFFQLYLITILKSNRISKILKDRLVEDLNYAFKFIILCLLVNLGRLNTTINFDYEMRSQLRTYHCIPVLQTNHDIFGIAQEPDNVVENNGGGSGYTANSVKQLQDTPRLKTILKSVSDFNHSLNGDTLEGFLDTCSRTNSKPHDKLSERYNLVSLIFHMSTFEEQLMDIYVKERRFEMGSTILTEVFNLNNAKPDLKVSRFLWMVYLLHETDLTELQNQSNPFGVLEDGVNQIPVLEFSEDGVFNVDTEKEKQFAQEMKTKRKNFLEIVETMSLDQKAVGIDQSSVAVNGAEKPRLNKKGRKRRIIKDESLESGPLLTAGSPEVSTPTSATTKQVVTRQKKDKKPVITSRHQALKLKADQIRKLLKDAEIANAQNPSATQEQRLKDRLAEKFIWEYINLQIKSKNAQRHKQGTVKHLESCKDTDLIDFKIDDFNEFRLKMYQLLSYLSQTANFGDTTHADEAKSIVNELF